MMLNLGQVWLSQARKLNIENKVKGRCGSQDIYFQEKHQ